MFQLMAMQQELGDQGIPMTCSMDISVGEIQAIDLPTKLASAFSKLKALN